MKQFRFFHPWRRGHSFVAQWLRKSFSVAHPNHLVSLALPKDSVTRLMQHRPGVSEIGLGPSQVGYLPILPSD